MAAERGAVHAEFDLRPLPAGPPASVRKSTALLLEGQKLARIQRQSAVLLGAQPGRGGAQRAQYASVPKPTSTSAAINTPDALFVGETYVLESVAVPALGVPRCAIEFTMPAHDADQGGAETTGGQFWAAMLNGVTPGVPLPDLFFNIGAKRAL